MSRKMQWGMAVVVAISVIGSGLVFAQGTSGTMQDKAMSPPSSPGDSPGKAGMPMERMPMPAEKSGMDKGMDKPGMGMDKPGMGMDKPAMSGGKAGMPGDKTGMAAGKAKAATGPVDLNTADEVTLKSLKGVGPAKAKAIVAYRQQHGPFKSVDELEKVPGIGKKTLASLRDKLTVSKGM